MQQIKPMLARTGVVVALATLSCALWGSAFAFVKLGYALFGVASDEPAQQVVFAGMRFCLAGTLVLVGTAVARLRPVAPTSAPSAAPAHPAPDASAGSCRPVAPASAPSAAPAGSRWPVVPTRADLAPILQLALSQTVLQYIPFYIGLAHASGTNSALVQGTSAFVQIMLATIVFAQEKLTARKLVACAMGLGGVAMVVLRNGGMVGTWSLLGEGLVLVSVVAGGCAACLMRRYGSLGDPLMLTGWQFLLGGTTMVIIGIVLGGRITTFSPQALGVLAYLGALSASAFSMWSSLLKYNPVSRVAMFRFFIPVFGVLFSVVALGENIPPAQMPALVVALALIVVGTVLVNTETSAGMRSGGSPRTTGEAPAGMRPGGSPRTTGDASAGMRPGGSPRTTKEKS